MRRNVLIPHKKPGNTFFEEIEAYSELKFIYGSLESNIDNIDIVLFHWPELLFNWGYPSDRELKLLNDVLLNWKKKLKFVYVLHNEKNHFSTNYNLKKLYELVFDYSDVIVHFGEKSKVAYSNSHPNKLHIIIPHPLYTNTFKVSDKIEARKALGIPKSSTVVVGPGRIRKLKERKLLVDAFKALKIKDKTLLVPYMYKKRLSEKIPGSYRLQKIKPIKKVLDYILNRENIKSYHFNYTSLSNEELGLYLSAADCVFISRTDTLNSGLLFLGLTYRTRIVGPAIGNIEEYLDMFNFSKFNPRDIKSVTEAINKAFQKKTEFSYTIEQLELFNPKNVALKWDQFLLKI